MEKLGVNLATIPSREIMPGLHGKLVHGQQISWAFWTVEQGAEVPEHAHLHEQIMHVVEGQFEFTLDGKTAIYLAGDVVLPCPPQWKSTNPLCIDGCF